MLSTKHANMLVMILKLMLVLGRKLDSRPLNLHYKKQGHGLRSLAKGIMNGIEHALMLGSPIKN
jgi:hypothetical protein